ncbi:MAG: C_GCAxxG_C_C family protein [Asgard group archaeon]|nr:C_GCAxxG_C_C family protein [Asgard group archaeon]
MNISEVYHLAQLAETKALDYFNTHNCCQAVLRTVLEEKGLMFGEAVFIGSGFGGGIIGRGEICGAVSGAVMAIGILAKTLNSDLAEHKKATREITGIFYERFEGIYGHSTCNGLIGIDKNDPEAKKKASEAGIYRENCPKFVKSAVSIVLDLFTEK